MRLDPLAPPDSWITRTPADYDGPDADEEQAMHDDDDAYEAYCDRLRDEEREERGYRDE